MFLIAGLFPNSEVYFPVFFLQMGVEINLVRSGKNWMRHRWHQDCGYKPDHALFMIDSARVYFHKVEIN